MPYSSLSCRSAGCHNAAAAGERCNRDELYNPVSVSVWIFEYSVNELT